jgi:hypothetical protein
MPGRSMYPRCAVCVPGPALGAALEPALELLETASRLQVPLEGELQRVSADGGLQNVSLGVRISKKSVILVTAVVVDMGGDGNPVLEFRIEAPPNEPQPELICHPSSLERNPDNPNALRVRDGAPVIKVGHLYSRADALALLAPFVDRDLGLVWCRHPRIQSDWAAGGENRRHRRRH